MRAKNLNFNEFEIELSSFVSVNFYCCGWVHVHQSPSSISIRKVHAQLCGKLFSFNLIMKTKHKNTKKRERKRNYKQCWSIWCHPIQSAIQPVLIMRLYPLYQYHIVENGKSENENLIEWKYVRKPLKSFSIFLGFFFFFGLKKRYGRYAQSQP